MDFCNHILESCRKEEKQQFATVALGQKTHMLDAPGFDISTNIGRSLHNGILIGLNCRSMRRRRDRALTSEQAKKKKKMQDIIT